MNRPDDDANEEPPNGEEEHKDYTSSDEDKDETEEGEDYHPYTPFVREVSSSPITVISFGVDAIPLH